MLLVGAVVLIASHTLVLRYALQHKNLSAAMVTGIVIPVVMTHLGSQSRWPFSGGDVGNGVQQ